jgi:hypothetical protein
MNDQAQRAKPAPSGDPGPHDITDHWLVGIVILGVIGLGLPLVTATHYGAYGIPRGDDWSYLVTLFRWVDSGRLSFNHWVSMTLVGQLVLAAPIAALKHRDIGAVQTVTAVLGFLGLIVVAATPARLGLRRGGGLLLAATIAAGPLWGPLSVSFMTDVPTFAISAVAMLLALSAFQRRPISTRYLAASVAVGCIAFTIRQYAIVTVAAALITAGWCLFADNDRARGRRVVASGLVLAVGAAIFLAWWSTVPDGRALAPALPNGHSLRVVVVKGAGFFRLGGLLLLPLIAFARPKEIVRRAWRTNATLTASLVTASGIWLAATAIQVSTDLFVGNYVMRDGVLSDIVLIGRRPGVLPSPVWAAITVVSSLAAIVLILTVVPVTSAIAGRVRTRDWSITDPRGVYLGLTIVGYGVAYLFAMATGLQVYDRYLLPALPAIGLSLLRVRSLPDAGTIATSIRPKAQQFTTAAAFVAVALVGFAFTTESASFDGARWRVATAATRRGWPAQQVNGGFEWLNYHRQDKLDPARSRRSAPSSDFAGIQTICVTVHINPTHVAGRVVAVTTSDAPTRATARLVAFRTRVSCRPRHDRHG